MTTSFEQDVAAAMESCFPPRVSGESAADYLLRAKAVTAQRVSAAIEAGIAWVDEKRSDPGLADPHSVALMVLRGDAPMGQGEAHV